MQSKVIFTLLVAICVSSATGRRLQQGYGSYGVEGIAAGTARGADTTAATDVVALQNLIISPWNLQSAPYEDQTSTVGSTITFEWPQGTHGVYRIPTGQCPEEYSNDIEGQTEIQAAEEGPTEVEFTFEEPGVYWFACPVDGHCDGGMVFKVDVA